jgi:pSer/pThr/pTyr-binding forkhead associated (FHA) protein
MKAPMITAVLEEVHGDSRGRIHRLSLHHMTIGRGRRCDIRLGQDSVSRMHARIERRGNEFFIQDLGSMNGTFVDDAAVEGRALADGALIKVGKIILRFAHLDVHDPEAPPNAGRSSPPAAPAAAAVESPSRS